MGKIRILFMTIILGTFSVFLCFRALTAGVGLLDQPRVRFRTLSGFASAASNAAAVNITSFGLLEGACRAASAWTSAEGGAFPTADGSLVVAGGPRADGYYFVLPPEGLSEQDPVRWVVETSGNNGTSWDPVGPCLWMTTLASIDGGRSWMPLDGAAQRLAGCADGTLGLASVGVAAPLFPHGAEVRVSLRAESAALWIACGFLMAPLGWGAAGAAALCGRPRLVRPLMVVSLAIWAVWSLSWECTDGSQGSGWQRGLYLWVTCATLPSLWSAAAFHALERHLVLLFFMDGLILAASLVVLCLAVFGPGTLVALRSDESAWFIITVGAYLFLGSVVFYFLRRRALRRARLLIEGDRARYDAAWALVLQAQQDDCNLLAAKMSNLEDSLPRSAPRQTGRQIVGLGSNLEATVALTSSGCLAQALELATGLIPGARKKQSCQGSGRIHPATQTDTCDVARSPLRSLDQLYVQATCLRPILMHKVGGWIAGGGNHGRVSVGTQISSALFVCLGAAGDAAVSRPCCLKSPMRAVEKLVRSYGQDASRLLDVCRQAIVFDNLRGLIDCLDIVISDPDVRVVRVKNRYQTGYNSTLSGGYRDVLLNLQLHSPEAVLLGVEAHVCELQLMLSEFAALKTEEGHEHYVTVRNLRAD